MGIRGLGRTFRHFDSMDGNRQCDANEFFTGLQDIGCNISKAECECLMNLLDTDKSGTINFDEFLIGVRGRLNDKRQAMVDKAFLKFDNDGNGCIEAADLKGVYSANSSSLTSVTKTVTAKLTAKSGATTTPLSPPPLTTTTTSS